MAIGFFDLSDKNISREEKKETNNKNNIKQKRETKITSTVRNDQQRRFVK